MTLTIKERNDVLTVAGAFPSSLCVKLIECYKNSSEDNKFKYGPREGKLIELSSHEKGYKELSAECLAALRPAVAAYKNYYRYYEKIICGVFKVVEYREGEGCVSHYDGYEADGLMKFASVVVYLNDDFLGGETVFPRFNLSVKPEAGTVVFFPSGPTHHHEVNKPVLAPRYVLLCWLHVNHVPSIKTVLKYAVKKPTYL